MGLNSSIRKYEHYTNQEKVILSCYVALQNSIFEVNYQSQLCQPVIYGDNPIKSM